MRPTWLRAIVLLAAAGPFCAGQQPKSRPARAEATASGIFLGRSGKPMAKAQLILGQVAGDQEVTHAKIKLSAKFPTAVADDQGRFQWKGFVPGEYTILYLPAGVDVLLPAEINIRPFLAVTKSIAPMLRGVEFGKGEALPDRLWGREFTLLKAHIFYGEGPTMKIWNATLRRNPKGPYMEIRRGLIWMERLQDKSQIKFEAWSY